MDVWWEEQPMKILGLSVILIEDIMARKTQD